MRDRRSGPEYRLAIAQGTVLCEIADLLFGNLGRPRTLRALSFAPTGDIEVTAGLPGGSTAAVLPLSTAGETLGTQRTDPDRLGWQGGRMNRDVHGREPSR